MHPVLERCRIGAALASTRPRLCVVCPDEPALLTVRAALEHQLGSLPQADELEPFHPAEPWELRIDLPTLTADEAGAVGQAVVDAGFTPQWSVAPSLAVTEAHDRGLRVTSAWNTHPWLTSEYDSTGRPLRRELHRVRPHDALQADLVEAVADLPVRMRSDQGLDTLQGVVERHTGRVGVELDFGPGSWAHREQVLARLTEMATRPRSPRWTGSGLVEEVLDSLRVVLWLLSPPCEAWLGDDAVTTAPLPDQLATLTRDAAAWGDHVEVQVVPTSPAAHDRMVDRVVAIAAREGWVGGRPRWVIGPEGPAFTPSWRAPSHALQAVPAVSALADVAAVRAVPAEPHGLDEDWPVLQPLWRWIGSRCWVRLRSGVHERDVLPTVRARPADRRDHEVADTIEADCRPVVDAHGGQGLEVVSKAWQAPEVRALLRACTVEHPTLYGIGHWGFSRGSLRTYVWFRRDDDQLMRTFVPFGQ